MINKTKPNRLIHTKSPYLLQHAHNPVDWWPWCQEAFAKAKEENKPVFLSIGYSACHWCHVMETEAFENELVARQLNEHFICILVDREERPDIDHLYMEACVALTGSGGWPLNVFLTPDKAPFYTGTYAPANLFLKLMENILYAWRETPEKLKESSQQILEALKPSITQEKWDDELPRKAFEQLAEQFDSVKGGFGGAPKFPSPHMLMFLQRYGICYDDSSAISMARYTLERMNQGGLFDQVGGGFFRYSVDADYLIPHFEKMLYDNAMLMLVYTEFGYFSTARRILDFCMREFYAKEGAFYTALDADSEGGEGSYYVFSRQEISEILGANAQRYCQLLDITEKGNFEGKSLPNLLKSSPLSDQDMNFVHECHDKVLAFRNKRKAPSRDKKLLLSSNSLMLAALSTYARLTKDPEVLALALRLAYFLMENMRRDGRFYGVYIDELRSHPASSDDYAYLSWGLLKLHQATLDEHWFVACIEVACETLRLFLDEDGLLRMTGKDVKDLPFHTKNTYDGALPSGNAIACGVFQRLYLLTGETGYRDAHNMIRNALAQSAGEAPTAYTALLSSAMLESHGVKVSIPHRMAEVRHKFHPFATFQQASNGNAIVCTSDSCLPPVEKEDALEKLLHGK